MKKANAGLMVASEVAKTKGGQEAISGTMQTANRVQSVLGWTITALIVAGGAYLIWKLAIKPTLDKAEDNQESRASIKEAELVLKELERVGIKADPLKDYKSYADTIQSAMSGWTEDDDKIAQTLMLIGNDAEFESLRVAWGGVDGTRPIAGGFTGGGSYTLTSAIQTYLDDSNKQQVNMNYGSKNMKTRV
jgi:hypothetical protein